MGFLQELGTRLSRGFDELGNKIGKVVRLGQKAVNSLGLRVSKGIQAVSDFIGIDKLAEGLSDALKQSGDAVLSLLPKNARPIVEKIYKMTPIGKAFNTLQLGADIISGRSNLSTDTLSRLFPKFKQVESAIQLLDPAVRQKALNTAKSEATKLAIGVYNAMHK